SSASRRPTDASAPQHAKQPRCEAVSLDAAPSPERPLRAAITAGTFAASTTAMRTIDPLLHETVARSASDLHITADSPPILRIHGELVPLDHPPLARAEARTLCYGVLTEAQRRRFESERELDFAIGLPGLGRFRGNLYLTRGSVAGAFRAI